MKPEDRTAALWAQFNDELGNLAESMASEQEFISELSNTLGEALGRLRKYQDTLQSLSGLASKEVLRLESATLNDEPPIVAEQGAVKPTKTSKKSRQKHSKDNAEDEKPIMSAQLELPLEASETAEDEHGQ